MDYKILLLMVATAPKEGKAFLNSLLALFLDLTAGTDDAVMRKLSPPEGLVALVTV